MQHDTYYWDLNVGYQVNSRLPSTTDGRLRWVAPGVAAAVAGHDLTGALVYIRRAATGEKPHPEPSLIDPALPTDGETGPRTQPGYVISYGALLPADRAAYLAWLAGGRVATPIPREFVRIFLTGIERRLLVDIVADEALRKEIPHLRRAVQDLEMRYRAIMYPGFVTHLIDAMDVIELDPATFAVDPPPAPEIDEWSWTPPPTLSLGLGCFVQERRPIPADWAFAWAWFRPEIPTYTPMRRAPNAYRDYFLYLYRKAFGDGLVVRQGKKFATVSLSVPNPSVSYAHLELPRIPDVYARQKPLQQLRAIAIDASTGIDPYSRWLMKHPEDAETLAAIAHLPLELLSQDLPAAKEFFLWMTEKMAGQSFVELTGADLFAVWSVTSARRDRLTPREAETLANVFGRFGFGIEPDFRLGKPKLEATTPVVVFRRDAVAGQRRYAPVPDEPSPAYRVAMLAAHFALALIAVEQPVTVDLMPRLIAELGPVVALDDLEPARLHAHLLLLLDSPIRITGLKPWIEPLDVDERNAVAAFAVSVAARHGSISPRIVKLVNQIYGQLGLGQHRVNSDLHGAMISAIPTTTLARRSGDEASPEKVRLDRTTIARKERETSEISILLGEIFVDDEPPPEPPALAAEAESHAGLDVNHSALLRALARTPPASLDAFSRLATTYHLLAAGAIDTLNEVALDRTDSPLIEGSDTLIIDQDVLQELLS